MTFKNKIDCVDWLLDLRVSYSIFILILDFQNSTRGAIASSQFRLHNFFCILAGGIHFLKWYFQKTNNLTN